MGIHESQLGSLKVPVFGVVVINTIPRRNQEHLVIRENRDCADFVKLRGMVSRSNVKG